MKAGIINGKMDLKIILKLSLYTIRSKKNGRKIKNWQFIGSCAKIWIFWSDIKKNQTSTYNSNLNVKTIS